jgi:hypothetical protein
MLAARDALRAIARRPQGVGLPDAASDKQLEDAVAEWEAWYRTIKPQAAAGE